MISRAVAILGVTGRLGPAVARALEGHALRGLSRRDPTPDEALPASLAFTRADRRDEAALAAVLDGCDVVVDLVCLSRDDADVLLRAVSRCARPPRALVFASSVAALGDAADGVSRREAQRRYEEAFPGVTHTLVLPRLVARVDPARREQPYLDAARATGRALVSSDGAQRQVIAPVEGVAMVVRALVDDPGALPAGAVNVGPPEAIPVRDAVRALLDGAGLAAPVGRHPDRGWRGPHGGGDEPLDTAALARAMPRLTWPDVREAHRALGRWLASQPAPARRPLPVVAAAQRAYSGRRTADVHDLRRPIPVAAPAPLEALARWITPAFYVDVGRPCNAACVYCAVPPHGDTEGFAPLERLVDVVKAGVLSGCERAILIGGEPTVYPALPRLLEMLRDAGFTRGNVVMTNGLALADEARLEALVQGGVRTFHVSVDTSDEGVYARLARTAGGFERQRRGLRNVLARGDVNAYVYSVVTRWNAPAMAAHVRAVRGLADALGRASPAMVMAFAKPVGDALTHAAELVLAPAERAAVAREIARAGDDAGVCVGFRNLQPCLAPELAARLVDACLEDRSVDLRTRAPVPYRHDAEYVARAPGCAGCAAGAWCPGPYREDVARHGDEAWRAIGRLTSPQAAR